jgi:hypothetical protein
MTVAMPDRIPLDMPRDGSGALADLVRAIAAAAYSVAAVDDRLLGAASSAPGWLGDDAAAAAAQVGAVTALVRDVSGALPPAMGRLESHAELLLETRRRVGALVAEQDDQFADAWRRLGQVESLRAQVMTDGAEVRAIVDGVHAGEVSRRRRHTALLEELEDDARATARVLADSCAVIGGRGTPGDANLVVAYLAAQLPGWGDLELARRGRAMARDLIDNRSPERRDELSRDVLPFAGSAAFAGAFLGALGPMWMRDTLQDLGSGAFGPTSELAQLMACSLGAAVRGGATGPVAEVLATRYVPEWDQDTRHDLAVLGMGTVLAANASLGTRGLDSRTVAEWGRQIAAREGAMGAGALARVNPMYLDFVPVDPLPFVVTVLADGSDPASAAAFLNGNSVWEVVLSRQWEDDETSLQALVASAGALEGPEGEAVVRGGLEALGARLEDGDAHDWPVNRTAANAVSPALAEGLAAHIPLAGEVLMSGVDGDLPGADSALLRGLGYVTLDRTAAGVVERALGEWVAVQPVPVWTSGPPPLLPAVVVPNAYLAVQDYGQQLAYTLSEIDLQQEAADRAFLWDMTIGLVADLAPGPWGVAAGLLADYVAMGLDLDGTWDSPGDHGLQFAPSLPTAGDLAALTPEEWTVVDRMARMAQGSFEGTQAALGQLTAPVSKEVHWWDPVLSAVTPEPADLVGVLPGHRPHPHSPIR